MSTFTPKGLGDEPSLEDVIDAFERLRKQLDWLLNGNLDVKNVRAKSITADRMDVDQLSAISANLGHITAGLIEAITMRSSTIIGSEIKTSETAYPRVEMSATTKVLRLLSSPTQRIEVVTDPGSGIPNFFFYDGNLFTGVYMGPNGTLNIITQFPTVGANINLQGYDILLQAFNQVRLTSWSKLSNGSQTLQQALDSKVNAGGYTGTFAAGTKTVIVSNGIITGVV